MDLGFFRRGTGKKTFFIHIGFNKTGTTSIQRFLHANREILREKGYLYPGKNFNHHEIAWALLGDDGSRGTAREHREVADEISREILESPVPNVIISTEFLCKQDDGIPAGVRDYIRRSSGENPEVRIISYVRRQDYWIDSVYRQVVRSRRYHNPKTFPEFFADFNQDLLDFYRRLHPWKEVFGTGSLHVRTYERSALQEGIVKDFLGTVGLDLTEDFVRPSDRESNVSLDRERVEIMRLCNKYAGADPRLHMFVVKRLNELPKRESPATRLFISPPERIRLLRKFDEPNRKIAREFQNREDGILFSEPWPEPDEPWEPFTGLSPEVQIGTFMEILLNMKNQRKAGERKNGS